MYVCWVKEKKTVSPRNMMVSASLWWKDTSLLSTCLCLKTWWQKWFQKEKSESESCSVLLDPLQPLGLPGSSVHGILQEGTLEWVAILFSRGSFQPRDWTHVSCITSGFFTNEPLHKTNYLELNQTPCIRGFPGGSDSKESPAVQETLVQSLGEKDPLEKRMATHSSILA